MRYTLKDYQEDAVRRVLRHLARARRDVRADNDLVAFALSATTGAGKTVIATAVIEALFTGSLDSDTEPDPTAVILWVTDDPSLNEQTRHRIIQSGDRLEITRLQILDTAFDQETFDPGRVYFLNVQKLSVSSSMVRTSEQRDHTLWDTIGNTIRHPERTLYLVLDEAHRGMRENGNRKTDQRDRSTTVQRLINGHNGVPPVPIVWGISATIERFNQAMQVAHGRTTYASVQIDPRDVQESGLLKDTIILDHPDEHGAFETTLLRSAVRETREATDRWQAYAEQESLPEAVRPLMVLQVPNKPKPSDLASYLTVIRENWPELPDDAVANVFGEHSDLAIEGQAVPYVPPERVQEADHIRILLAKDAVSTGWDCPRAEVLFSLRPAQDRTHITQLLGRMVRTPLARRIESDERLNAASCYLPYFDRSTVTDVVRWLQGDAATDDPEGASQGGLNRKVLTSPVTMEWNSHLPDDLREFFGSLPSQTVPRTKLNPIKRLLALATALSQDALQAGSDRLAVDHLTGVLDGQLAQHRYPVDQGVEELLTADIRRVVHRIGEETHTEAVRQEQADDRTVDEAFRSASRQLGAKIANGFERHLAFVETDDEDADFLQARATVAVLVRIPGVVERVLAEADTLTRRWLDQFRSSIRLLNEERTAVYNDLRRHAGEPQPNNLVTPMSRIENTRDADNTLLPTRDRHLLADTAGQFPVGTLNEWELAVLDTELAKPETIAWYRNPSSSSAADAIQVPYQDGDRWRPMQPDFIFFSRRADGSIAASIVDPHGHHLADALPKLKGFARFAAEHLSAFVRFDSISKLDDVLKVLDLTDGTVRDAIADATQAAALYTGPYARNYH